MVPPLPLPLPLLLIEIIFAPEISLPLGEPLDPARQKPPADARGPVVGLLVGVGDEAAAGEIGQEPCGGVEEDIADDAAAIVSIPLSDSSNVATADDGERRGNIRDKPICNRVCERDDC
jgi:hypothetical protein